MTTTIKVIAYAEQCVMQGQAVTQRAIEEHGKDCADYVVFEGTSDELLETADEFDRKWQGLYKTRLANTIRKAVYAECPELEKIECERCEDMFHVDDLRETCDGQFCDDCYWEHRVEDANFRNEDNTDCQNEW